MSKSTIYQWANNDTLFISNTFITADEYIEKIKISIGYLKVNENLLITEIRESWKCRKEENNSTFSNQKCERKLKY